MKHLEIGAFLLGIYWGVVQLVERWPLKSDVTGSNPVALASFYGSIAQ